MIAGNVGMGSDNSNNIKKTVIRSIRLTTDYDKLLEEEAKEERTERQLTANHDD